MKGGAGLLYKPERGTKGCRGSRLVRLSVPRRQLVQGPGSKPHHVSGAACATKHATQSAAACCQHGRHNVASRRPRIAGQQLGISQQRLQLELACGE